jgi:hypothetical protein
MGVLPFGVVSALVAHQRLLNGLGRKYKRLQSKKKAHVCWQGTTKRYLRMFTHWKWVASEVGTLALTVYSSTIEVSVCRRHGASGASSSIQTRASI